MAQIVSLHKQRYTPLTGDTISAPDTKDDIFMVVDTVGSLVNLTVALPPTPEDQQQVMVSTRSSITSMAVTSNGLLMRSLSSTLRAGNVVGWVFDYPSQAWFSLLPPTIQPYTINVQALTSSPADAATAYFGMLPKAPVTVAGTSKIYVRKASVIRAAEIYCFSGTAGSNESWSLYIRINDTTDTLIATVSAATSERIFSNPALNILLGANEYFEIKMINPTWGTNPLTTIFGGYITIE